VARVIPSSIRVRRRTAADESFIVRLSALAFAEFSRDPVHVAEHMARTGQTWVAELAGAPVGFAVVRALSDTHAEICAIAVSESARGLGIGQKLMHELERDLARTGINELSLHTADANSSALALFSKCGFRSQRHLPRFYRGVFDAWVMRKRCA
jgi:ribosomal protein S18 acetylase RimI-like enzyme